MAFTCENLGVDTETGHWICSVGHNNPTGSEEVQVPLLEVDGKGTDISNPGTKTIYRCNAFALFGVRLCSSTISNRCPEAVVVSKQRSLKK